MAREGQENETMPENRLRRKIGRCVRNSVRCYQAFSSIDSDFSGTISFDEFKTLMNVVDENIQDDKISNLFHQMDTDGNETLGPGMY